MLRNITCKLIILLSFQTISCFGEVNFKTLGEKHPLAKKHLLKLEKNIDLIVVSEKEIQKLLDTFDRIDQKSVQVFSKQINDIISLPEKMKSREYLMNNIDPYLLQKVIINFKKIFNGEDKISAAVLIKNINQECQ